MSVDEEPAGGAAGAASSAATVGPHGPHPPSGCPAIQPLRP